jgi:hypothetical protein
MGLMFLALRIGLSNLSLILILFIIHISTMISDTLLYYIGLVRCDFACYRLRIIGRTFPSYSHISVRFNEFFYFIYFEKLWDTELTGGPPYERLHDLFKRLDHNGAEIHAAICHLVIYAERKLREHEEIQRYSEYINKKVLRAESALISITPDPDRDPHFAMCHFLTECDNTSIQDFINYVTESRFQHWDKVCSSLPSENPN